MTLTCSTKDCKATFTGTEEAADRAGWVFVVDGNFQEQLDYCPEHGAWIRNWGDSEADYAARLLRET